MTQPLRTLAAFGYLLAWLQPVATLLGLMLDAQWAGVFVMFGVFGFARPLFGEQPRPFSIERHAWVISAAQWGVLLLACAVSAVGASLLAQNDLSLWGAASIWACLTFATPASHALGHSKAQRTRRAVELIEGAIALPLMTPEHRVHHQVSGICELSRNPRRDESAWRFVVARLLAATRDGFAESKAAALRRPQEQSPLRRGCLGWVLGATAWIGITWALGAGDWAAYALAFGVYLALGLSVFVSVQLVTYVQHWGLGDDVIEQARQRRLGWQDTCRLQRWVTFDLSLHYHHHLHPTAAHHSAQLLAGSPVAPASYVLLLCVCTWPALWRRLMDPVLDQWLADQRALPDLPSPRLTCFRAVTTPGKTAP